MADGVTINPGSGGAKIATDDVGGEHYQRVKLAIGADGVADDISAANPVPVEIQGSIPVTIASAIEITNDAGNAIPVSSADLVTLASAVKASEMAVIMRLRDDDDLFLLTL